MRHCIQSPVILPVHVDTSNECSFSISHRFTYSQLVLDAVTGDIVIDIGCLGNSQATQRVGRPACVIGPLERWPLLRFRSYKNAREREN